MKRLIAKYLLYIYLNFIKFEEYDIYKEWIVFYIRFIIFVRNIYIWIGSIIFFPFFIIGMIIENKKEYIENILLKIKNIYIN